MCFAALDIRPHLRYVVEKVAQDALAATPNKFCPIRTKYGLYTKLRIDPRINAHLKPRILQGLCSGEN